MMLSKLKYSRGGEKTRGTQLQRRISEYVSRHSTTNRMETHSMKSRIRELEEEIERLRTTVKFYQDIYLLDE